MTGKEEEFFLEGMEKALEKMKWGGGNGVRGYVASLFRCLEDGTDNLTVYNGGDLGGWGGGGDGESEDAKGVRA